MEVDKLWKNCLAELEIELTSATQKTLFSGSSVVRAENQIVEIGMANQVVASMAETRYYGLIKKIADRHFGGNNSLVFTLRPPKKEKATAGPLFPVEENLSKENNTKKTKIDGLNLKYTFENLVVGNSNNVAYAAAKGIADRPGESYNPFFIYGDVGVGKTHLMHAIGHAINHHLPEKKIVAIPAETFTNDYVESLQTHRQKQMREKYRNCDVLLVDDVQFIGGKEGTQEEFFYTFNILHNSGRQVVLTSDRTPEQIPKLEARLSSRFMSGLMIDIQPPDYEMRVGIIKLKISRLVPGGIKNSQRPLHIEEEAVYFIAENVEGNIRGIEGVLTRISSEAELKNEGVIDLKFVKKFFHQDRKISKNLAPKQVLASCAKHFGLKISDLIGPSRKAELVYPRQMIMYYLYKEMGLRLEGIGDLIGGRDHTTVLYATGKIRQLLESDESAKKRFMELKRIVLQG